MGLSSAVQWWQEWQLRILVLGSLSVQLFIYFAAWLRRQPTMRKLRWLLWVAYIGGDALAIYALATLFNRQKQQTADGGSSALEVLWAPVLLIHLGGQQAITAYSLEDNELWRRHAITLVSQVTVALYVFVKWWSGEKRLLLAAILLFVLGILKFSEKPWALRSASFNRMLASTTVSPRRKEGCIALCWELKYITDPASYRAFNNLRGQWTLRRSLPTLPDTDPASYRQLRWSLTDLPFDESVLVWHIATDLCFHKPSVSTMSPQHPQELKAAREHGREISNYMVYLLFIHPEMLMPGSRPGLFTNAIYDLGLILKDSRGAPLDNEETLAGEIYSRVESLPTDTDTVITHACKLAKALMLLGDEAERWPVIQGVWVEMLCYSASRCRGYLHAKSLGEGGEYLTIVWLIWSFMGMETLADRLQRPQEEEEEEEEEEAGAAAVGRTDHPAEESV